jgi:hypothetical protein
LQLATGGEDGVLECFDPRARTVAGKLVRTLWKFIETSFRRTFDCLLPTKTLNPYLQGKYPLRASRNPKALIDVLVLLMSIGVGLFIKHK